MRDIKFRAWIKKTGDMLFDVQNVQPVFGETFKDFLDDDYCVLMQYTGLTDKNGVEIYEGDILRRDFDDGDPAIGSVTWSNTESGYIYNTMGCGICFNEFYAEKLSEVVGNIYENPELLEERKVGIENG